MQLYPESAEQLELITAIALKCGFSGGLVVDYPNSRKARKHYLVLNAGLTSAPKPAPEALGDAEAAEGATFRCCD
jgi:18S rRNA (guanine1575-N7)-methyltransferase